MTAKELINKLNTELTEKEKDLPICFNDSEWGASQCEIKSIDVYRFLDKTEAVVLDC